MRAVAYYRVSTTQQGQSGLGLEAQRSDVQRFLEGNSWPLVAEFVEVESGKGTDRPQLQEALAACRLYRATLVIAKLDRLARNAVFLLQLREAGIAFVCCDMPAANRLTIGILALVAEDEAERVSARTKAALAAAKARGTVLGGFRGYTPSDTDRAKGLAARHAKARGIAAPILEEVKRLQAGGIGSPYAIAKALNAKGIPAMRGGPWQTVQVQKLLATRQEACHSITQCNENSR